MNTYKKIVITVVWALTLALYNDVYFWKSLKTFDYPKPVFFRTSKFGIESILLSGSIKPYNVENIALIILGITDVYLK